MPGAKAKNGTTCSQALRQAWPIDGVNDILIAVVDGLKGFPEAITSVFPQTVVLTCIVHLIRNSLAFVSWKDRKAILPSIKAIYRAENADMALVRLDEFEAEWGKRYPAHRPGPHLLTSFPSCARANSGFLAPLLSAARYPNAAQRLENLGAVNRPWK